jgi:hypothetical protein
MKKKKYNHHQYIFSKIYYYSLRQLFPFWIKEKKKCTIFMTKGNLVLGQLQFNPGSTALLLAPSDQLNIQ